MIIINKPQPNISIQGTPRFKGHYIDSQGCPLNNRFHCGAKEALTVLCQSLAFDSWFTSFSRVLPTSQMGYHTGKPLESVVGCFYKVKLRVYRHNKA